MPNRQKQFEADCGPQSYFHSNGITSASAVYYRQHDSELRHIISNN